MQTLVIDEGFGSQDSEGRQKLVEAINLIRDDFAKILVITHLEELKDAFSTRIEVEKDPQRFGSQGAGMSKLNLRPALVQRVLPTYRAPFFEKLSLEFENGLNLFAGLPRVEEQISTCDRLEGVNLSKAGNIHLFRGRFYLCWQKGLINWLKDTDPDVLILEANPRYLRSPAAIRWMHTRNRPVIGWGLGAGSAFRGMDFFRQRFTNHFDALLTYSHQGAEGYRSLGFPAEKIFVAPNAVTPRPQTTPPTRPESLITPRAQLLFVGRLQERKRLDLLIRACAALPAQLQPELHIVGEGSIRSDLENLAGEVYPHTLFYGEKDRDRFGKYLPQSGFICPARNGRAGHTAGHVLCPAGDSRRS